MSYVNYRPTRSGTSGKVGIIAVLAILVVGFIALNLGTKVQVKNARVTKTERVNDRDSSYYLVFTDKGTFRVADSLWVGRWNSSDLYGSIEPGHRYDIKAYGLRIPLFSSYPNIESVTESK